jgi:hypothetical protein
LGRKWGRGAANSVFGLFFGDKSGFFAPLLTLPTGCLRIL